MKKPKHIVILLLVSLLPSVTGCHREVIPEGVIDTATMAAFLTEAHLIDSYDYIVTARDRDSLQGHTDGAYGSLFAKYGITAADYDSSMSYYVRHPKTFEEIYHRVYNNLTAMRDSIVFSTDGTASDTSGLKKENPSHQTIPRLIPRQNAPTKNR